MRDFMDLTNFRKPRAKTAAVYDQHAVALCKKIHDCRFHRRRARTCQKNRPRILRRPRELLHQALITFGFFDRVQVLPLQIFDQCQLHDLVFLSLKHHRRNVFQTCLTCCTPAALTCNDLVVAVLLALAHRDWCDDAVQANALCQLVQRCLIKDLPRLIGIRLDFCQRQVFCAVIQTFFH